MIKTPAWFYDMRRPCCEGHNNSCGICRYLDQIPAHILRMDYQVDHLWRSESLMIFYRNALTHGYRND